jgi:hypothetical protein
MDKTSNPLDLAKIKAEHGGHYPTPQGEVCRRCLLEDRYERPHPWPCPPYRLAELAQEQADALADAWDEGFTKAGRLLLGMDDDAWPPAPNPYRAALAGEQPES